MTQSDAALLRRHGSDDFISSAPRSTRASLAKTCLAAALAVLGGVMLPIQASVNTNLSQHAMSLPLPAAAVNFAVGLVAVSIIAACHAPRCGDVNVRMAPWYSFTGGFMGASIVVASIFLADKLGLVVFQMCVTVGQLLSSLALDTVGFLHLEKTRPTLGRAIAVLGLMAATVSVSVGDRDKEHTWQFLLFCMIPILGGSTIPVAACVNTVLTQYVGTSFRALVLHYCGGTFLISCLAIANVWMTEQQFEVTGGEPWMWTGGLFGLVFVACNLFGLPMLGAGAFTTLLVASQLSTAFCLDLVGAFGFPVISLSAMRLAGVILAIFSAIAYQLCHNQVSGGSPRMVFELESSSACA